MNPETELFLKIERLLASSDAIAVEETTFSSTMEIVFSQGDYAKNASALCEALNNLREAAIQKRAKAQETAQKWEQPHADATIAELKSMANFDGFGRE